MYKFKKTLVAAGFTVAAGLGAVAPASAEPTSGVIPIVKITCPLTGPGVAACTGAGLIIHELVEQAGGKNGIIGRNIKAGEKEKTLLSKITRGTLGISTDDIRKHGLAGGPNSEVRKAGRAIAKVFGW